MKRILPALLLLSLSVLGAAELPDGLYARMSTNRGTVVFTLDYRNTPLTTANFCALAEGTLTGSPFYDGLTFYRHAAHYAIFSGDPENTGEGGPGYTLPREKDGALETDAAGVLVMDGFPEESSGSRFFITQSADAFLKSKYTPFGRVVSGKPVVFRLRKGDRIESLRILRVGKEAEELDFSPGRIAALREEAEAKLLAAIALTAPEAAARPSTLPWARTALFPAGLKWLWPCARENSERLSYRPNWLTEARATAPYNPTAG